MDYQSARSEDFSLILAVNTETNAESLGIALCHGESSVSHYTTYRAIPTVSYFSSFNYMLLKRRKNSKSPLKRDRFFSLRSLFAPFRYVLFFSIPTFLFFFFSFCLARFRLCLALRGVSRDVTLYLVLFFRFSLLLTPPLSLLLSPISLSIQTTRRGSKAFQMKAFSRYFFPTTQIASGLFLPFVLRLPLPHLSTAIAMMYAII